MDYQTLKARHRLERDNHHVNLTLRVHRSLSWLQRAEQADDPDGRFVFLWIAFNAAYATDIDENYRLAACPPSTLRNGSTQIMLLTA